jgi:hypothetical protein
MWNVFEQPWTLLGAAVLVLFGVLTFRSVWPDKQRWWQWLLPAGVAALALGLDFAVATDLEKINRAIRTAIKAAEREDVPAIARLIAADYQDSYHESKQSLVMHCRQRLVPPAVQRIRRINTKVELSPPRATVALALWITFEKESYWAQSYKPNALVNVRIDLRKQPDKTWLASRIEVLEVDKMSVTWRSARDTRPRPVPSHSG